MTDDKAEKARPSKGGARRDTAFELAFGQRIRAARIAAGISQGALGKAAGVSFQQVQKYERGKDRMSVGVLQSIATALGVHPGAFFDVDMPAPAGRIPDVKAVVKIGQRIQRVQDPAIMRRLLALADVLASAEDESPAEGNGAD